MEKQPERQERSNKPVSETLKRLGRKNPQSGIEAVSAMPLDKANVSITEDKEGNLVIKSPDSEIKLSRAQRENNVWIQNGKPRKRTDDELKKIFEEVKAEIDKIKNKHKDEVNAYTLSCILPSLASAIKSEKEEYHFQAAWDYLNAIHFTMYHPRLIEWTEELVNKADEQYTIWSKQRCGDDSFTGVGEGIYYTKKNLSEIKKLGNGDIEQIEKALAQATAIYKNTMPEQTFEDILDYETEALFHQKFEEKTDRTSDPSGHVTNMFIWAAEKALKANSKEWAQDLISRASEMLKNSVPGPQYGTYFFPNLEEQIHIIRQKLQD